MQVFEGLDSRLRQNLVFLFATGFSFWSSLASLLPTLPLYIQDVAGGTKQEIGIVMGAFAIGLLCFRASLGRLADQRSRTLVLLIGLSAAAIAPLCYIVVQSIPLLMVVRAFHGISIAAFTTGYSTLVVDLSPPGNRGEVIGYMSLVNPIGMAVGPALGGFLQVEVGYTSLFLLSSGLAVLGLACTSRIQERSPNRERLPEVEANVAPPVQSQFWHLLASPRVRVPALVLALIGLVFGTLSTFVPLYIDQQNIPLNVGLFYTTAAIASFSVRLITGRASDRIGRGLFITISLAFYGISMGMLWAANSAVAFLLTAFIQGLGSGILIPMMAALMADRSYWQERARVFSLC
ncbi:MAG TPA: MFS transporter, partial [Candidatus Caenarcaniphilales bacterium]